MKLDELSFGQVYVDTNIPYMYLRADPEHLPTIKTFDADFDRVDGFSRLWLFNTPQAENNS